MEKNWNCADHTAQAQKMQGGKTSRRALFWALFGIFLLSVILSGFFCAFPGTIGLMMVNLLVFCLVQRGKWDTQKAGSSFNTTLRKKQFYRLFACAFTHKEHLHLFFNLAALFNLGSILERVVGTEVFLLTYLLIIPVGGTVSCLLRNGEKADTLSIGASGAICGLLGIYIIFAAALGGEAALRSILPTLGCLGLMCFSKQIDNEGHITGVFCGLIAGVFIIYFRLMQKAWIAPFVLGLFGK